VRRILFAAAAGALLASGCALPNPKPATSVTDVSATLNGDVHSNVTGETTYWFRLGATNAYTRDTPRRTIDIQDPNPHPVSEAIGDLTANTLYHWQMCAFDRQEDPSRVICSKDHTVTTDAENGGRSGIAFSYDGDIHWVNAAGGDTVNLTEAFPTEANSPKWSPDGRQIAFESDRDLYVMDADGSNPTNVTNTQDAIELAPRWSPDGQHIAYESRAIANDPSEPPDPPEIIVSDSDGGNAANLTDNAARDASVSWFPDSHRIAFASDRDGLSQIYAIDIDGSDLDEIGESELGAADPAVSPDGARIAYSSTVPEFGTAGIWVMDSDGGDPVNLTNSEYYGADRVPLWAPDGSRIAYRTHWYWGDGSTYVVDADGTDKNFVVSGFGSHSWSPDSQYIASVTGGDYIRDIEVAKAADGSDRHSVTSIGGYVDSPDWSPLP
jgi:Tol biopolymer transport system component